MASRQRLRLRRTGLICECRLKRLSSELLWCVFCDDVVTRSYMYGTKGSIVWNDGVNCFFQTASVEIVGDLVYWSVAERADC